MNDSKAIEFVTPVDLQFLFETTCKMRTSKESEAYQKWFDHFIKVTIPCKTQLVQALEKINDS